MSQADGPPLRITPFEQELMERLLADDQPIAGTPLLEEFQRAEPSSTETTVRDALALLRRQFAAATIRSREFSGAGSFTHFDVPGSAPRLPRTKSGLVFGNVQIKSPALPNSGGSLVFVDDGTLLLLETYTYTDEMFRFPDEYSFSTPTWRRSGPDMWTADRSP